MSDKHQIRNGIIGTVVGGLIVAAILGALGKIPSIITGVIAGLLFVLGVLGTVFRWLGTVSVSVFEWLATPLSLPIWFLAVAFSVVAISTKRRISRWNKKQLARRRDENKELLARRREENKALAERLFKEMGQEVLDPKLDKVLRDSSQMLHAEPDPEPQLDDVQKKIMHLFATLDGGQLNQGDISQRLRVSALRVDQALEQLENNALVATDLNFLSGTTYVLTTKGRDFVLERGWVGEK